MTDGRKNNIPPDRTHKPSERDRNYVYSMASHGVTQPEIAMVLDIDEKTLRKHYRRELDTAQIIANHKVASTLFRKAIDPAITGPSVAAAKFYLECRAGWRRAGAEPVEREMIPDVLGKKAQQARDAENAGAGTEWGDDLTPPGLLN